MRIFTLLAFVFFVAVAAVAQQPELSDRIIVKFNVGAAFTAARVSQSSLSFGIPRLDAVNQKYGVVDFNKVNTGRDSKDVVYTIKYSAADLNTVMQELNATGLFEYSEPDYIGHAIGGKGHSDGVATTNPNDPLFYQQWGLYNDGTFSSTGNTTNPPTAKAGADIKMKQAWDIEQGSPTVIVGFIDTGCKLDHPEFSGRIWVNTGEIPGNGIDDDGNGYIDDVNGWDFQNNDNNPTDDNGHGTNVTSIVGENGNNSVGFAGMDWNCKLMITKGLDNTGSGLYSTWASCIHYLVDNGANIINMSVAGTGSSTTLQSATDYAYNHNVLVVAAMGNDNTGAPNYPAANTNVMAVGATNTDDTRCNPFFWGGGSSFGSDISVCAPGNVVYGLYYLSNTDYTWYYGGTSQATPHVAALAALLKAQLPSRTAAQIRTIIETTADDQVGLATEDTPGWDQYYGHGRINAYRALSALASVNDMEGNCADFEVFPNPANKTFQILINGNVSTDIIITDVLGKVVWEKTPVDVVTSCDCNLAAGIYFVSCRNSNHSVTKKLLIY